MERNEMIADFGVLNEFFDKHTSPEEFLNELTDLIEEYSRLAIMNRDSITPFETTWKIGLLGLLHKELRKVVKIG